MISEIENKLNAAARTIFESEIAEYSKDILEEIEEMTILTDRNLGDVKAKEVYDTIEKYKKKKYGLQEDKKRLRSERLMILMALAGVVYSVLGSISPFFFVETFKSTTLTENFPTIITLVGSLIALGSLLMLYSNRVRRSQPANSTGEETSDQLLAWQIVKIWTELEKVTSEIGSESTGPANTIRWLRTSELLSTSEHELLKDLLTVRNQTVHGLTTDQRSMGDLKRLRDFGISMIEKIARLKNGKPNI